MPLLFSSAGVLTRNHPYVRADLLATLKPRRSPDDQHIGQCRETVPQQLSQIPILRTRTQICGKLFSRMSRSRSRASSRSNFCFFTRLALISAGSPIHT